MKRINCFLLACLMLVAAFSVSAAAALPETVQPLWNNTYEVIMAHDAIGTTAHCCVDITIREDASLINVSVRLIDLDTTEIVQEWEDPEMDVDSSNQHSFYDTVEDITLGHTYRLVFQAEVWRNGVCDYISQGCNATY